MKFKNLISLALLFVLAFASPAFAVKTEYPTDVTGLQSLYATNAGALVPVKADADGVIATSSSCSISIDTVTLGTVVQGAAGLSPWLFALPTGASTAAKQDTGNTSVASIDTKTPALGQALAAGSTPVVLTAAQITALTPPTTVAATQSGVYNITNVSGTVSLPTGAATSAKQPALGTAGTPSADVITVQGRASMTPILTTPLPDATRTVVVESSDNQIKGTAGTVYAVIVTYAGVTAGDKIEIKNSTDNSGAALIPFVAPAANGTFVIFPPVAVPFDTAMYYDETKTGGTFKTTVLYV